MENLDQKVVVVQKENQVLLAQEEQREIVDQKDLKEAVVTQSEDPQEREV
jgi:hypothetical protein